MSVYESSRKMSYKEQVAFDLGYKKGLHDAVKHGKWEFGRQRGAAGYWCTNCKSGFTGENAEWIAKEHDFCPKCGARMDGE